MPTNKFRDPTLGKRKILLYLETYPQSITYYFVEIGTSSDIIYPSEVTTIVLFPRKTLDTIFSRNLPSKYNILLCRDWNFL